MNVACNSGNYEMRKIDRSRAIRCTTPNYVCSCPVLESGKARRRLWQFFNASRITTVLLFSKTTRRRLQAKHLCAFWRPHENATDKQIATQQCNKDFT